VSAPRRTHGRERTRRDVIRIRDLRVVCIVGVYPHERDQPQPLTVDVEMELDTGPAGESQRLRRSIDYAAVASQLAFLLESCRFQLLETAAHALTRFLLAPPALGEERARVQAVRLRLEKPLALLGNGVPSLEVFRDSNDVRLTHEEKPFGTVDIVHETRDVGIYRLNIAPGRGIPLHVHRVMQESEMVLGEGLLLSGKEVPQGAVHRWPHDAAHRYDNPTTRWQSILCVDTPPFVPEDEIEVTGEPTDVAPERPFLPRHPVVGS
jgi:FolB domain-containing protein